MPILSFGEIARNLDALSNPFVGSESTCYTGTTPRLEGRGSQFAAGSPEDCRAD